VHGNLLCGSKRTLSPLDTYPTQSEIARVPRLGQCAEQALRATGACFTAARSMSRVTRAAIQLNKPLQLERSARLGSSQKTFLQLANGSHRLQPIEPGARGHYAAVLLRLGCGFKSLLRRVEFFSARTIPVMLRCDSRDTARLPRPEGAPHVASARCLRHTGNCGLLSAAAAARTTGLRHH